MRRAEADYHSLNMLSFPVKLLVALTCFTAVYTTGEAADTCPTTTTACIPGLPGRDGKDGQPGHDGRDGVAGPAGRDGSNGTPGRDGSNGTPGRDGHDGLPGPPGSLTIVEQQQLKDSILEMVRDEISMLCHQSQQCNETSADSTNTPMPQPCNTPQPTPQPGPHCTGPSEDNPATSCKEVYNCDPTSPSGYYWVNTTTGPVQVYCEMDTNNCGNITGGWMRAAYINMTNVNSICPQGLTYTVAGSIRMCISSHSGAGCNSVIFPTRGVPYNKVCGRAFAYQHGTSDAFSNNYQYNQRSLNDYYVDGLSVTYGSPRSHIWTFADGLSKGINYRENNCPCALYPGPEAPPFVGENYFCESGISGGYTIGRWYLDDPLWDSQGCVSGSTCCNRGGPWFTTTLNQEVIDDIEVRWCFNEISSYEDIGVEQLEIYVY